MVACIFSPSCTSASRYAFPRGRVGTRKTVSILAPFNSLEKRVNRLTFPELVEGNTPSSRSWILVVLPSTDSGNTTYKLSITFERCPNFSIFFTIFTVSKLTKTTLPINRTIYSSSSRRLGSLTMPLLLSTLMRY